MASFRRCDLCSFETYASDVKGWWIIEDSRMDGFVGGYAKEVCDACHVQYKDWYSGRRKDSVKATKPSVTEATNMSVNEDLLTIAGRTVVDRNAKTEHTCHNEYNRAVDLALWEVVNAARVANLIAGEPTHKAVFDALRSLERVLTKDSK